jgi:hypothetical protein
MNDEIISPIMYHSFSKKTFEEWYSVEYAISEETF